ncbi:MAG: uridine kinase [Sumerlaeia bacterium]
MSDDPQQAAGRISTENAHPPRSTDHVARLDLSSSRARGCIVVGIAGGSGSGKSTVARRILKTVPPGDIAVLGHDCYYHDLSYLSVEERAKINFDHPDALDNDLMVQHLDLLRSGTAIERPIYNFVNHTRMPATDLIKPARIIVVEGILIFCDPRLRERMDIKLYVDCDADVRFIRRLKRDVHERGRSLDSVVEQYLKVVRQMHLKFVEPSKRYADVIIPEGGHNAIAIDMVTTKIASVLAE